MKLLLSTQILSLDYIYLSDLGIMDRRLSKTILLKYYRNTLQTISHHYNDIAKQWRFHKCPPQIAILLRRLYMPLLIEICILCYLFLLLYFWGWESWVFHHFFLSCLWVTFIIGPISYEEYLNKYTVYLWFKYTILYYLNYYNELMIFRF